MHHAFDLFRPPREGQIGPVSDPRAQAIGWLINILPSKDIAWPVPIYGAWKGRICAGHSMVPATPSHFASFSHRVPRIVRKITQRPPYRASKRSRHSISVCSSNVAKSLASTGSRFAKRVRTYAMVSSSIVAPRFPATPFRA